MQVDAKITGLSEAYAKLEEAEQKTSLRVIRGSLRFGIKPAIARAKQLVPVDNRSTADDYSLRDSLGVRAERKKYRGGNATVMRFGAHRETTGAEDTSGYAIKGGLSKGPTAPNYSQLIEEKTPFLLPAIEQTQDEVVRRFGQKFFESVNKL